MKTADIASFKKNVLQSIYRPDFLKEESDKPTVKNLAFNGGYNILCLFLDGISKEYLKKKNLNLIVKQIEHITYELDTFLDSKQLLMVWAWIGSEVDIWINLCLELEYYESAANLKKIMETYFND